ncbi:MAG: magnesium transporter CorA family protein [Deltaproteobacteria bacterium]|jgi:magnesium transporter|nr:magnesium transporter CorA family protein [Deltaproteobacteria bacterium]
MIASYLLEGDEIIETQLIWESAWINLENPLPQEQALVAERLNLPLSFLSDPLDPRERPRLDNEDNCLLIIVRLPIILEKPQKRFETIPLGVIIAENQIITICREPGLVRQLLDRQVRKPRRVTRESLLFKLFVEISSDFIHQLQVLEELAEEAEKHLSKSQRNVELMILLTIEKALINFSVALHSNRAIMEKLLGGVLPMKEEQEAWLEYALTENQQAIFTVEVFGQIVGSMGDAFGVIISNNLNKVMKFLTGVTIILMVPTLVVGAYGMNVKLPLAEYSFAFYILAVICLAFSAFIWIYFNRKKWI